MKALTGEFHIALLGAPQIEEGTVIPPGQIGVLPGVKKTAGEGGQGGVGPVNLEVQPHRPGREGANPPGAAVGQGGVQAWGTGKGGLTPGAGDQGTQFIRSQSAVPGSRLVQKRVGVAAVLGKRGVEQGDRLARLQRQGSVKPFWAR